MFPTRVRARWRWLSNPPLWRMFPHARGRHLRTIVRKSPFLTPPALSSTISLGAWEEGA